MMARKILARNTTTSGIQCDEITGETALGYKPLQHATGGVSVIPTYTDNGNGSITVGNDGAYNLYSSATTETLSLRYSINGGTFTLTDGAINYIYADYNAGSPQLKVTLNRSDLTTSQLSTTQPIFTLYRRGTTILDLDWDTAAVNADGKRLLKEINTNRFLRDNYIGGLTLSDAGSLAIGISGGTVWYGLNAVSLAAMTSASDPSLIYVYNGSTWSASSITAYNNTQYQGASGLSTLTPNRYAVNWVWRCVANTKLMYVVLGTGDYTLTNALASAIPSNLPDEIRSMGIFVGRIIVQKSATTATEVDSAFVQQLSAAGVTNHNDLSNIQGGTTNEYYHLTSAQSGTVVNMTSFGVAYGVSGAIKSTATTGLLEITGPAAGTTRVKTFRDADDTVLEQGGSYSPSGVWTFTGTTVATALGGGLVNLSGSLSVSVSSAATSGSTYATYIVHTISPASSTSASNHALRVEANIPSGCSQAVANARAIVGATSHAGSGLAASLSGAAFALTPTGSGGATLAYGCVSNVVASGAGPIHESYGVYGGVTLNNASLDSNTIIAGGRFLVAVTTARNLTLVAGVYMSGVNTNTASSCPNVYGFYFGNINAGSTTPATLAAMFKTGNVIGGSLNRQFDCGTGTSLFNDTTDATSSTSESSLHIKGGFSCEKSAWFGGPVGLKSYTVATVPSASSYTGCMIYVSNESGGATPAFSDGTNWRRDADRAIIS